MHATLVGIKKGGGMKSGIAPFCKGGRATVNK